MSPDLPEMRNHAPASRLTGYRLFRIFGFDVRLNLTWLLLALLISHGWRAHTARRYPHPEPHRLRIRPGLIIPGALSALKLELESPLG